MYMYVCIYVLGLINDASSDDKLCFRKVRGMLSWKVLLVG